MHYAGTGLRIFTACVLCSNWRLECHMQYAGLSKALLHRAAEIFAHDDGFRAMGITVNAICPGWVETEMAMEGLPNSVVEDFLCRESAIYENLSPTSKSSLMMPKSRCSKSTSSRLRKSNDLNSRLARSSTS